MAALTDKFRKGAPFFQTTLSGSMTDSDTTFTLTSAADVPTDTAVDFVIDRIDQNGELLDPSLREVITGTVSGTTVTTDATRRGLDNTTAQSHTAGAVVEVNFTADTWNDHIDGLLTSHNQDGTLKDDSVDTAQIADDAVEAAQIADDAVGLDALDLGNLVKRQGGSATEFATNGTTTQAVSKVIIQFGSVATLSSGGVTVTFPTAFSHTPVVVATKSTTGGSDFNAVQINSITATNFVIHAFDVGGVRVADSAHWIAIGPVA